MSITKSQNKPITVSSPIEIEKAVNEVRLLLSSLTWISHPYFIAQRFVEVEKGRLFVYPETYAKAVDDERPGEPYHRLTPDNDYTGMFFAYVHQGRGSSEEDTMKYKVSFIFSVNLELINAELLQLERFTRKLMSEVRKLLKQNVYSFESFTYYVETETDDLQEVYREFRIEDLVRYSRLPMQCFRFDLQFTVEDEC